MTAKSGITVETGGLITSIEEMQDLITGKDRDIMRYGRSIMRSETKRAFSQKVDPQNESRWKGRDGQYAWPLLRHTSTVYSALDWSYGIKTRNKRLTWYGKIRDGHYLGGYNRGNGAKPLIVVAGSLFWGRTKARSVKGTKVKAPGGGFVSPMTGKTPPRPFFGFGRSARHRIKLYAEKRLAKVFD